jgi:hypothetical protein
MAMPAKRLKPHAGQPEHPEPPEPPPEPLHVTCANCGEEALLTDQECPHCHALFHDPSHGGGPRHAGAGRAHPEIAAFGRRVERTERRLRLFWLIPAIICAVLAAFVATSSGKSRGLHDWALLATFGPLAIVLGLAAFPRVRWAEPLLRIVCGVAAVVHLGFVIEILVTGRGSISSYGIGRDLYLSGGIAFYGLLVALGGSKLAASWAETERVEEEEGWLPRLWS